MRTHVRVRINHVTLTRLLKVLVGRDPGVSEVHQAGLHGSEVYLGAVAPGVLCAALTPAVPLPTHELALLVAADVAERSLHEARPQVLWQYGLQAWRRGRKGEREGEGWSERTLFFFRRRPGRGWYATAVSNGWTTLISVLFSSCA